MDENMTPTVWVDTNVLNEIYSHGDAFADGPAGLERRRLMLQGSAWLAMTLDDRAVTSLSFRHEAERTIERRAPPHTPVGAWTSGILYVLRPHVFPRWNGQTTNRGAELPLGDSDPRDQLMIEIAGQSGLTIVTRDRRARNRARRQDVPAMLPEEFAEKVMAWDAARDRFLARLDIATAAWLTEHPQHQEAMVALTAIYGAIWAEPRARVQS